jgi:hypothetical protein
MKRVIAALTTAGLMVLGFAPAASAYDYPSTNDENRAAGHPHVDLVGNDIGEVTLEFDNGQEVSPTYVSYFEYRIDGETPDGCTTPHPVVAGDCIHPGQNVTGQGTTVTRTFEAAEYVEVRLALGGERDWDFDWVRFDVVPDAASTDDCQDGAWEGYGFDNQGQCLRFVQTGKDSRE